jgi:hypothetical protein
MKLLQEVPRLECEKSFVGDTQLET